MILSPVCRILLGIAAALAPVASGFAHGSFHEQAAAIEAALREKPDDPRLLFRLAALHLEHGDSEAALAQLARLDAAAPGTIATDLLRGRALAAAGKFAEARARFDAYIAAQPGNPAAYAERARVQSELGDAQAAAADAEAALGATPHPEPEAYLALADFLVAAGRGEEAVRALDRGVARLGAAQSLAARAIELELALGRADAAIARSAAGATTPASRAAHAAVLARGGRDTAARAAWQALRTELAALPPLERASHAMRRLAEQADAALATVEAGQP